MTFFSPKKNIGKAWPHGYGRALRVFVSIGLMCVLGGTLVFFLFDPVVTTEVPPLLKGKFVDELVAGGFEEPTALAIAPNGTMFVAERQGVVRIIKNGESVSQPFVTLTDVHTSGESGLLGLAVHPRFPDIPYVYLLYSVQYQPHEPPQSASIPTFGRLVRYTAEGNVAAKHSEKILIGNGPEDGIPNCSSFHGVGAVKVASDGSIYVSAGEGASWEGVDVGERGDGCDLLFGAAQGTGARRAQQLNSLAGKILRIDSESGLGLPDNPFYDGDTDSPKSRIFGMGLRNPFRFTLRESTGESSLLYVGDVGWTDWEEITIVRAGTNAGWPCFEGPVKVKAYHKHSVVSQLCQGVRHEGNFVFPLLSWNRSKPRENWFSGYPRASFTGHTVTGLTFYTGKDFPQRYWGALFFADYGEEWIKVLWVDDQHQLVRVEDFAGVDSPVGLEKVEMPVDLEMNPTNGNLLYVSISAGQVRQIRFVSE
ncbi:MAG: PQQ-dependent sugar dehydrogenase [Nitrospirota bacterium]|nr:PQQ-dependent sugar dehydrogenase [Nitrospirota bacterium]